VKIGILIIGSLWWRGQLRATWRVSRLKVAGAMPVRAPIHYGRLSSTDTDTMTFAPPGTAGIALVVPCQVEGEHHAVGAEADELWGAEDDKPTVKGKIAKSWGSVGALFRAGAPAANIAAWTAYFQKCGGKPLAAVGPDGLLTIPWPQRVDGRPLECDMLLATTNVETAAVTPEQVADAWIAKGDGEYFFENVRAGIRTPDDERIWRRMAGDAAWLDSQTARHSPTIAQLQPPPRSDPPENPVSFQQLTRDPS
jgi:hypothetical protein